MIPLRDGVCSPFSYTKEDLVASGPVQALTIGVLEASASCGEMLALRTLPPRTQSPYDKKLKPDAKITCRLWSTATAEHPANCQLTYIEPPSELSQPTQLKR